MSTNRSASYLRQTIMLSPYETPDFRHIFSGLKNLGGKKRVESPYSPVQVPEGVTQVGDVAITCTSGRLMRLPSVIRQL